MLVATAESMALPMRRNCVAEPIATASGNLQYSFELAWGVAMCERGGRGRGQTMISDRGSEQHAGAEKVDAV
jgi:hypothetical protein